MNYACKLKLSQNTEVEYALEMIQKRIISELFRTIDQITALLEKLLYFSTLIKIKDMSLVVCFKFSLQISNPYFTSQYSTEVFYHESQIFKAE